MTRPDVIRPLLESPLADAGYLLEDLTVTPAGRRRVVRVVVDRVLPDQDPDLTEPTAPLTLDEVSDATRLVSDALDGSDALGEQAYTLEVTSPGVDRPLRDPHHFRRNVGRLVRFTLDDGSAVTGRIVRAGAADLTLEVPPAKKEPAHRRDLPYAAVSRAQVQVEFSRGGAGDGSEDPPVPAVDDLPEDEEN